MPTPAFLCDRDLRLLLFGGKGGVGKTTCAAATALQLAARFPQASFLLVSIDPAHSLADSLAGLLPPANLKTLEIDAHQCLQAFKSKHAGQLREIVSRGTFLDAQDIEQFLELSLPGMDELMAFLEIAQWVKSGNYDCLIVDTAPTEHSIRLLTMPELMQKWLDALDALLAKHRYLRARFGSPGCHDEADDFLRALAASVTEMKALLQDSSRCRFVPVMLAEALSIAETLALVRQLERLNMAVREVVVNRLVAASSCPVCKEANAQQTVELARLSGRFSGYTLWGVPLYAAEVRGREGLEAFWKEVGALDKAPRIAIVPRATIRLPARVEAPAQYDCLELRLLLFAGKGGVGKTTLACATALRLARNMPRKKTLLLSADPSHCLSGCLGVPIGAEPTRIQTGLWAMEIDAQARFDALKQNYREELDDFLASLLPNADLVYDRAVMERILELSPPGLDEVMALTGIVDLLDQGSYDVIVVDSAPTGHLIRLLELPELIEQWLKVIFGVFLKYKRLFRLPAITDRLIEMSKSIKRFRAMVCDRRRAALFGVTILTMMAFEETKDLLCACQRLGISVPVLFLNLATPASRCPLCAALHAGEQEIRARLGAAFPGRLQTLVYRQSAPRGMTDLEALGQVLYAEAEVLCKAKA